jgi:hypothetical protein
MQAITETSTNSMNTKSTIEINEANFEAEVLKSSQPLLVEFTKGCTRRTRSESSPSLTKTLSRNVLRKLWHRLIGRPAPTHDLYLSLSITLFNFTSGWDRLLQKQRQFMA